jgi:predicted RNase H-like nuclease (RuvC/YqgF family)
MDLSEQIIAFAGTGVGSVLIGNWINKKRDKIEVTLKEQIFYKNLIGDIQEAREIEKADYVEQVDRLTNEIKGLKDSITQLINVKKEQEKTIEQLRIERQRWEDSATNDREKYVSIINQKDDQISKLFGKVEQYEKQNTK